MNQVWLPSEFPSPPEVGKESKWWYGWRSDIGHLTLRLECTDLGLTKT